MYAEYKTSAAVLKALRARRNLQEIARLLKVHRSLVYLLKKVLNQNQDAGEADATSIQNEHKKGSFCLTQTVDFVASPPKTQPKSPWTG